MAKAVEKIVIKNIDELIAYENNPRKNDSAVEAVANSIKTFGFKIPVVIDSKNVIVCGHTRVKACKRLGIDKVPCVICDDLTQDEINAFRVADNKTAEIAEWDFKKLEEEVKGISLDLSQFGFDDLLDKLNGDTKEDEFDENEALPENPYAKKGDIFLFGKHRLVCGDSTKKEDVDKLVDGKQVDLFFTDPPYNVDYEGGTGMKIQNDKQKEEDFYKFLLEAFKNAYAVSKPGASGYICHPDCEELNFLSGLRDAGWNISQFIIWVKNSFVFGRKDYHCRHEMIAYIRKEGAAHYFIDDRTQDTVWEYNKPKVNDLHPTMKPIELVARAIKNSSRKGEIVLDLFGGSGTSLISAEQVGRICFMMELDEKYTDVIAKRYLRFIKNYDDCFLLRDGKKTALKDIPDYEVLSDEGFLS